MVDIKSFAHHKRHNLDIVAYSEYTLEVAR